MMSRAERLAILAALFHVAAAAANEHTSLTEEFALALKYESQGSEFERADNLRASRPLGGGSVHDSPTPSRAREEAGRPTPDRPPSRPFNTAIVACIIQEFYANADVETFTTPAVSLALARHLERNEVLK